MFWWSNDSKNVNAENGGTEVNPLMCIVYNKVMYTMAY